MMVPKEYVCGIMRFQWWCRQVWTVQEASQCHHIFSCSLSFGPWGCLPLGKWTPSPGQRGSGPDGSCKIDTRNGTYTDKALMWTNKAGHEVAKSEPNKSWPLRRGKTTPGAIPDVPALRVIPCSQRLTVARHKG
eukprot:scaffold113045_cov17-Tisochrysis_lutea.AAC.5